jgi:oligoendopeptidase F
MTAAEETLPAWDLTEFYNGTDDPKFWQDVQAETDAAKTFEGNYKGRVAGLNAAEMLEAIREYDALAIAPTAPAKHAYLLRALDQTDKGLAAFENQVKAQVAQKGRHTLFFELEIRKAGAEHWQALCDGSPELTAYRPYFNRVLRYTPHTLNDQAEDMLKSLGPVSAHTILTRLYAEQAAQRRFELPDALLSGKQIDRCEKRGEKKEGVCLLTAAETYALRSDPNEATRKAAHDAIELVSRELATRPSSPAFIMNHLIQSKQILDKERGYTSDADARHLANDVEKEVVDAMVEAVKDSYATIPQPFFRLKAKMLGEEVLSPWNLTAPLKKTEREIPWSEAKQIVLEAFEEFSPEMAEIAQMFFDKGWIDAAPNPNKRGGAFSMPNRAAGHPNIMMNYLGKARDVSTLAHELGHGIHQYLAAEKQGDLMDASTLTFSETASTFCEMLVFKKLLAAAQTPEERRTLLSEKLNSVNLVVHAQTSYHEFETRIHGERQQGELTAERFAEIYKETQKERTGDAIAPDPESTGHIWGNVPHFFRKPFYVYSYAFGDLLAVSLYKKYEEMKEAGQGQEFVGKYLDILSAASTEHHSEMFAKRFGPEFDLSQKAFWESGLKVYEGLVQELGELVEQDKVKPANAVTSVSRVDVARQGPQRG